MKKYIKLMRVHHYIKYFLIYATIVCGGQLFNTKKLSSCCFGFAAFCMYSSIVYIINDIVDKDKDKLHPTKCKRPIASGKVSTKQAIILAIILFVIGTFCNLKVFHIESTVLLCAYLILNLAYSFKLKNIVLVDITILVLGFIIRVVYGSIITDIIISNWLYLTVIAASFYFALGKRRNELRSIESGTTRKVLKSYSLEFLDKNMYMCLGLTNTFYALWSMDKNTVATYNKYMVFTVPIVLLISMKYCITLSFW